MKTFNVVAALAAASSTLAAVSPVTVKGNAFFVGNTRFYIRGVDYQPGGSSLLADPIADLASCTRDIAKFKKLGINTVRIYTVDNTANHDACMTALSDAGIYLVLDVNTPKYSINRANPGPSYNTAYLQNIFATIDIFAKYPNTLAFFSGNEVVDDEKTTNCAPYVKAVTRDIRQYLRSRSYRQIPVGYSAADVNSNRLEMANYMNCGTEDERSDFFAFNDYSWCDPSSFTTSGWDQKVKNFTGYGLPLFLSEYGCNTNKRVFGEVASLYSTDMTGVYSGGLVYEYSQETSNYGLVSIENGAVTELADFTALTAAFKKTANPSGDGGYNAQGGVAQCPPRSSTWDVNGSSLPAIPSGAVAFMRNGAGKGVGLQGPGSQNAGGASTGTATPGSGAVGATASPTKNAAPSLQGPMDKKPMVIAGIMVLFSAVGAALL